jgi:flavin reductase (DIM6/NTAB) family NADH-FMN oxidoreductase RutF
MLHYPTNKLTEQQSYKFLSGSIIPRPIAWVTSLNTATQGINAAPFSFFNAAASEIPLATLSILRKGKEMKDTAKNILDTNELVIHLVSDAQVKAMNQTAASLPSEQSEITMNQIETVVSQSVTVPGIKDAPIRMEARLHQYVPIKNRDEQIITDLFIVEITDFYFAEEIFDKEKEYILPEKFNPLARLAGATFAHISDLFELKRPK